MSYDEIRRLERAVAADPSDAVALEALARALTRAGRGWAGETLPRGLECSPRASGVYVWTRHGLGMEMVRVPWAPEVVTIEFDGGDPHGERLVTTERSAFWIGRYPVTNREFDAWCHAHQRLTPALSEPDTADHPVVRIGHDYATAFCAWAGLRLPTSAEWTRAALGDGRAPCPAGRVCVGGLRVGGWSLWCRDCDGEGSVPRKFPWGNEAPTPKRCVAGGVLYASTDPNRRTTLPVRDADDRPARPDGASPCGAMDTVGHVWEMDAEGSALGGSFQDGPSLTRRARLPAGLSEPEAVFPGGRRVPISPADFLQHNADDIGFRVALSEAAP